MATFLLSIICVGALFAAPAEAAVYEQGTFTANTTSVNVGFKPRAVIFYWSNQASAGFADGGSIGMGFAANNTANGVEQAVLAIAANDNAFPTNDSSSNRTDSAILIKTNGNNNSFSGEANVTGFTATGFTLSWSQAGGSTVIHYIALDETEFSDAKVGNSSIPTSTGTRDVTSVNFQPDFVMTLGSDRGDLLTGDSADSAINIGLMSDSSVVQQATLGYGGRDNLEHDRSAYSTGHVLNNTNISFMYRNSIDSVGTFVSMLTNGFRINVTNSAGSTQNFHYLALEGGLHDIGLMTKPTSNTSQAVTGVGFEPKGLMFLSNNDTQASRSNNSPNTSKFSIGAASPTSESSIWFQDRYICSDDCGDRSDVYMGMQTDKAILMREQSGTDGLAALSSMDADGFTLNWTSSDGSARRFVYWAVGSAALPNSPPTITSNASTSATEDIQYTYNPTVSDDGPGETWSKLGGDTCPSSTINSGTGAYAFTAAGPNPISSCTLSIQVCDGASPSLCDSETVTVNVTAVNDQPTITSSAPTSATEDIQYNYNPTFSDPENQGATWSKLGGDTCPSSTINSSTGAYAFTASGPTPISSCTLSIQACDGGAPDLCASETETVNVTAVNDPPTITSTAPTSATEDTLYSYTPTVNDLDGPATNWTVRGTDTCGGTFTSGTYDFTPAGPTPPANCQLDIQLCDGGSPSLCTTQTTTVTINPVDDPSTLTISQPSGQLVTAGTSFNITYTLSDPEGNATVNFYYDTSGSGFSGTPISGCANQVAGTNQTCTWDTSGMPIDTYHVYGVSSDSGSSAYSAGTLTITAVDDPSTLTISEPSGQTLTAGTSSFNITYTLSDPEGIATVSLYYDTSGSGFSGTAISGCANQVAGTNQTCAWDISGMPSDTYYVYGVPSDSGSSAYSAGTLTTPNVAPVITSSAATAATEDIQYTYNPTVSDPDGPGTTWSKLGDDTCPSSTLNSSTGAYAFTAAGPDPLSSCTLSIQVCDGGTPDECDSETVTVNVTAVNDQPIITSTAPASATEDTPYSYTPTVNDLDGPATNWTVRGTDTCGGTFTSGTYDFTPAGPTAPASCQLDIQLCDGGTPDECTTQTSTVTITAVDDPSTLTISQPSGQTVSAGTSFNITYTLSDPEGNATVTFYYDTSGSGFSGTAISGCANQVAGTNQTCTWDTSGMPVDTYHVYGVSSDSGSSAYSAGTLTITPNSAATLVVNQPDGAGDTITQGGNFTVNYDLSDSDDVTTVAFFYDTNNSGADGTAIGGCAAEPEATGGTCAWNTSGVAPGSYYVYGTTSGDGAGAATVYSSGTMTIDAAPLDPLTYVSGDDGTNPGGGDSIAGISRSGGGNDSNNLESSKWKIDVEYEFSIHFIDDSGESPVVEPMLYIAHRDSPTEGAGGDFFVYPLVCTGVTWGSGKTCSTTMKLGPAAIHKFYFYAEKTDGTVESKPSSGYTDGPEIQFIRGYSLAGVARDIDSKGYDGYAAFNSIFSYGWASTGLDTSFDVTFNGDFVNVTSFDNPAETGRGYFVYKWGRDTLPQLGSDADVTAASHTTNLQTGWNMISNPYNGNVKLDDVQIRQNAGTTNTWSNAAGAGWIEPAIYYFQGDDWGETHASEFGSEAELIPWLGYWMYVKDANSYELIITKPAQ